MKKYIAKLRLSKDQYLAIMDNALVVVTEDVNGKPVKWNIFESRQPINSEDMLKDISTSLKKMEEQK